MAVLGYCTVGSNRLEEAKTFYDALLGSAGISPMFEHPSGGRVYSQGGHHCFVVLGAYNGNQPRRTCTELLHVLLSRPRRHQALRVLHCFARVDDKTHASKPTEDQRPQSDGFDLSCT